MQVTVCDMGTTNVKALDLLGCTADQPHFNHEGNRIISIFDPPHLLKCTRNMFFKLRFLSYILNVVIQN